MKCQCNIKKLLRDGHEEDCPEKGGTQVGTQAPTHHDKCGVKVLQPGKRYRVCECWPSNNPRHSLGGRIATCDYVSQTGLSAWFCSTTGGGREPDGSSLIHRGTGTCVNRKFLVETDLRELNYLVKDPNSPGEYEPNGDEILPPGWRTVWVTAPTYEEAERILAEKFTDPNPMCLFEL